MSLIKCNVLISYDVNGKQDEVKESLKKIGYRDNFTYKNNDAINYLPETTLYKSNTDTSISKSEMLKVCSQLNVSLERFVATEFSNVTSIQGEPYKN
jgi:hypothetical protein